MSENVTQMPGTQMASTMDDAGTIAFQSRQMNNLAVALVYLQDQVQKIASITSDQATFQKLNEAVSFVRETPAHEIATRLAAEYMKDRK